MLVCSSAAAATAICVELQSHRQEMPLPATTYYVMRVMLTDLEAALPESGS